jgi:hypothetical protein
MDIYEQLRRMAKKNYNEAIESANERYRLAINNINMLHGLMDIGTKNLPAKRFRRSPPGTPFAKLKTLEAAEAVLIECGPLTMAALTIQVQQRGHRSSDDPRKVLGAIKSAFQFHKDRFVRDAGLHWIVI